MVRVSFGIQANVSVQTKQTLKKLFYGIYPKPLQVFACPAVIHSYSAVFTTRDDVFVICSKAHHSVAMDMEALNQWFSIWGKKKKKNQPQ